MTIRWNGPWSTTDITAVGQRYDGWSNMASGAGALKTRHDDGDPVSAAQWREMYGNLAYHYDQSRRMLWDDVFITGAGTDPTKQATAADFDDIDSIYTLTPALELTPNYIRGRLLPPRLKCKVRAKREFEFEVPPEAHALVRIYAIPRLGTLLNWNLIHDGPAAWLAGSYCEFTITATGYPATPGWSSEETIEVPAFETGTLTFELNQQMTDVTVWTTHLVLCGIGVGCHGPLIAAVQVWEEGPGDG